MLIRVKWHLVLFTLFVPAGLFFFYHQTPYLKEDLPSTDDYHSKNATDEPCHQCSPCDVQPSGLEVVQDWDSSRVLRGAPTEHFRNNLLNDTGYLTTGAASGFTNQFMTYVNMIYLATLSGRVPIIPPFNPGSHVSRQAGALPFGQIFNLTLLRNELRRPILEWSEVKYFSSPTSVDTPPDSEREELGCWSTRREDEAQPVRINTLLNHLRLDVSYTRVPTSTRYNPNDTHEDFVVFSKLVPYIFSHSPLRTHLDLMSPSPLGHRLPPDEQLSCFDHLYYITSSDRRFEWEAAWSPAWNLIGTHVRFTDQLLEIAKGYLSRAFDDSEIPSFIAVHDRRGDFARECKDPKTACLTPLSTFAEKVDEIRETLLQKHNKNITKVLFASDEEDPTFWEEVRANGWIYFNHTQERTQEELGEWFIPIVDIVSQSLASGFVGTEHSTFSLVSSRRVKDWNDGPTILVPPK